MTEKEKRTILDMRAAGKQYKEISAELGFEVSALKLGFVHLMLGVIKKGRKTAKETNNSKKTVTVASGTVYLGRPLILLPRDQHSSFRKSPSLSK